MPSVERNSLVGQKFGRLTVVSRAENIGSKLRYLCHCECGNSKTVYKDVISRGLTKSCGCLSRELIVKRSTKHKLRHSDLYPLWSHVVQRTTNPNDHKFLNYGGRGIKMHPKWEQNAESFIKYLLNALGPKPTPQHSLDRIDNEKGYIPGNLRWATMKMQNNNRRPRRRKSA